MAKKNYLEMARPENKQQQVIQSKFMKLNGMTGESLNEPQVKVSQILQSIPSRQHTK